MEKLKKRNILIASVISVCVIAVIIILIVVNAGRKKDVVLEETETQVATEAVMETETEDYSDLYLALEEYKNVIEEFDIESEDITEDILNENLDLFSNNLGELTESESDYNLNADLYSEYSEVVDLYNNSIESINTKLDEIAVAKEETAAAKAAEQNAAEQKAAEQAQAQTETASQPAAETPAETPSSTYVSSYSYGDVWRKYTNGQIPDAEIDSGHWIGGYYLYVWSEANQCWYQNGGNIMNLGTLPQSVWTGPASSVTTPPDFSGTYDGEHWGDTIWVYCQ